MCDLKNLSLRAEGPNKSLVLSTSSSTRRAAARPNGRSSSPPTATTDQHSGVSYYTVRISIPEAEVARLGGLKLLPGMPLEAFIQTGDRTVLSYLMKPMTDQIARSFRGR
jgi:HlyD family secretion protein